MVNTAPFSPTQCLRSERGATMVEVLVAITIIVFGLLGLAGLQARLQISELESYQRTQAILLLNDMVQRVTVNRNNAASYATGLTALGSGMTCPVAGASTVSRDLREWCQALQGDSESSTSGGVTTKSGHMIGGRGCVESLGAAGDYMVTVTWQGMTPISAPPASVGCGVNEYDGGGSSSCKDDLCRRVVTTVIRIATL
jgi:type IV pilus assembly protein PilV